MDVITRRGERLARPDVLEPSQQVSVEDYLERLSLIQENNGLYSMYLTYTLDELGNPEAFSGMSEVQFYALMDLARVSYEEGRWDERDDMRRHAGKTEIAMRALFTQSYEEFNARM